MKKANDLEEDEKEPEKEGEVHSAANLSTRKAPAGQPAQTGPPHRTTPATKGTGKRVFDKEATLSNHKTPAGQRSTVTEPLSDLRRESDLEANLETTQTAPGAVAVAGIQARSYSSDDHPSNTSDDEQPPTSSANELPIPVQVVDDDDKLTRMPSAHASPFTERLGRKCMALIGLVAVVIAIAVATTVVLTQRKESSSSSNSTLPLTAFPTASPTGLPSASPSISAMPSQAPTIASGRRQAFETTQELYDAVDAYLEDSSVMSDVVQTYGWPIDAVRKSPWWRTCSLPS